jgi:hypothetical protein
MRKRDGHFTDRCFPWPILEQGAMRLRHLPCGSTVSVVVESEHRRERSGGQLTGIGLPQNELSVVLKFTQRLNRGAYSATLWHIVGSTL